MLNKTWDGTAGMDCARVVAATLLALFAGLLPAPDPHRAEWAIQPGAILPVEIHAPRGALLRPPHALFWSTTRTGSRIRLLVSDPSGVHVIDRTIETPRQLGPRKLELLEAETAVLAQARRWTAEVSLVSDQGELLATSGEVECWIGP